MSISSIGSALAAASQKVSATSGSSSSMATALQESSETPQVTAREARQGDPVARQKLRQAQARLQQQKDTPAPQPKATEAGKGNAVDHEA